MAVPSREARVVPGVRDVQEAAPELPFAVLTQVFARDVDDGVRRAAVGHRERLEVQTFRLGALAKELPVVAALV